jgi:large subunit ribosomal protein L47
MEFFDDKKNWNENEVKHGRSWQLPELRIKSNTDLHKLWFVLLKEKNMLLTMEQEHKRKWKWWASPERIDKVNESMTNIEAVVRERNTAYHLLETGETGERPGQVMNDVLGLRRYKKFVEHAIPFWWNKKYRERPENQPFRGGKDYNKFIKLYRERLYNEKRKAKNRDKNHVIRLLRRYPNIDRGVLEQNYPSVNLNLLHKKDKFRGHYIQPVD